MKKNNKTLKYFGISCLIGTLISGCASSASPSGQSKAVGVKVSILKAPKFTLPGSNSENWRYIGTTSDNQIADEIDNSSIESTNTIQIYKYQDRKTIIDPTTFNYLVSQAHYKFSISSWLMDCTNEQYLLLKATIYDMYGTLIKSYDYSNDNNVRWLKFGQGSIASMQYNYICLNQNRELGY